jgi:hypothetical protein
MMKKKMERRKRVALREEETQRTQEREKRVKRKARTSRQRPKDFPIKSVPDEDAIELFDVNLVRVKETSSI